MKCVPFYRHSRDGGGSLLVGWSTTLFQTKISQYWKYYHEGLHKYSRVPVDEFSGIVILN